MITIVTVDGRVDQFLVLLTADGDQIWDGHLVILAHADAPLPLIGVFFAGGLREAGIGRRTLLLELHDMPR